MPNWKNQPEDSGLEAARRYSGWYIGERVWADRIIEAYLNPESTHRQMDSEGIPQRTGACR